MGQLTATLPRPSTLRSVATERGYDPAQHEPEFEFFLHCERTSDHKSVWRQAIKVEGIDGCDLSDTQRHWLATVLHHAAVTLEAGEHPDEGSMEDRFAHHIKRVRIEARVKTALYLEAIASFVLWKGEQFVASKLGMRLAEVRHIAKNRPETPKQLMAEPEWIS